MAALQQLKGKSTYTLLLMQGEERMSRQHKIYILEQDKLQEREVKPMMKMLQAVNEIGVRWHQEVT